MPEEPTDADIEAELADAPDEAWAALWRAAEAFEADPEPARMEGGSQIGVNELDQPIIEMPYVKYSDGVERLLQLLVEIGAIVPGSRDAWDLVDRYREGRGLDDAPVVDVARLLSAVVHAERFATGAIAGALADGTLGAALERLRTWYEDERRR